jgi:hypothetical protein
MSYSREDYEADKASEYLAEEAYEALAEEAYWNCKHEEWSITDAGIVDVDQYVTGVLAEVRDRERVKKAKAILEIRCDRCGREAYGKVPYTRVLELLRMEWNPNNTELKALDIDEDSWDE